MACNFPRVNIKGSVEKELAKLTDVEWPARAQSDRSDNLIPRAERVRTRLVLGSVRKQLSCTGFDASSLEPLAVGWDLNNAGWIGQNSAPIQIPREKENDIVRQVTSDGMWTARLSPN